MYIDIFSILLSYFWGAIPTAYLIAKYYAKIDITKRGSQNIGASNLATSTNQLIGYLIGVFDAFGKGSLPILIFLYIIPTQYEITPILCGLASIAGHNWSPYIKFKGGRGLSTTIGVLFAFQMWPHILLGTLFIGIMGRIMTKDNAFWTFVTIIMLPIITMATTTQIIESSLIISLGITCLLIGKRITSNSRPNLENNKYREILIYRIIWDRDIKNNKKWINRNISSEN